MRKSKSQKTSRRVSNVFIYILLVVLSIVWLFPIVWLIIQSFRGTPTGAFPQVNILRLQETYCTPTGIVDEYGRMTFDCGLTYYLEGLKEILIPSKFTLQNYANLLDTSVFKYPKWFLNTFIVAVFSCIITTIITLLTSYAFSRLRFKARKPLMNLILILGMFPGFMSMIAIYHILKIIGLDQTLAALVIVYSGGASMGYYISKGFFDTIPRAIDESALIDGATKSQIFWKITLPLSKPIVVYTVLTSFIGPWCDFIFSSIIMRDNYDKYTVALGLYQMISRENIDRYFTTFCAGAVVVAIPITLLFIKMQKYYVGGVTAGGVKG